MQTYVIFQETIFSFSIVIPVLGAFPDLFVSGFQQEIQEIYLFKQVNGA